MNKRLLIVGPIGSGSQRIAQAVEQTEQPIRKVASLHYTKKTIIVPYLLRKPLDAQAYYRVTTRSKPSSLSFADKTYEKSYPPNFAQVFRIPVLGIITYEPNDYSEEKYRRAQKTLREIGIKTYQFQVDLTDENALHTLTETITTIETTCSI
ncbi:EutP/PduV family microcompartment system protein [Enterococcus termitis]